MPGKTLPQPEVTPSTTTPSAQRPIPATFNSGPKLGKDGVTVFHKNPDREAFDQQWRERIARGEDPMKALSAKVDSTPPSSGLLEVWWRKVRGKKPTREMEREVQERKEGERVETGKAALLGGGGGGEGEGKGGGEGERTGKSKLHDRLRWGI